MSERISMREASRVLGVSQLRVRELIRKGTLQAEKVVEDGSERWAILSDSVQQYLKTRPQKVTSDNRTADPRGNSDNSEEPLTVLLAGLEEHLQRVRTLIKELTKAQSYLDGLRSTQNALESEVARLRSLAGETPSDSAADDPRAAPAVETGDPSSEEPKAETEPEEPKAEAGEQAKKQAKKPTAKSKPKGTSTKNTAGAKKKAPANKTPSAPDTALAAALFDAGVAAKPAKAKSTTKKSTTKKKA